MPTTFNWIYPGTSTTFIDPTEGNTTIENGAGLQGFTSGNATTPLYSQITSATMINNGGRSDILDANNNVVNDQFTTTIGGTSRTLTYDGGGIYTGTITYADGTTATSSVLRIVQSTTGELFLAPPAVGGSDPTLSSFPIQSVTLTTYNQPLDFLIDRQTQIFKDFVVQGTTGNDLINGSYAEPGGSDVVDGTDGPNRTANDDIRAGAGNDTVFAGLGNDSVDGGAGNDVIQGGAGADTLNGGADFDTVDYGDSSAGVNVDLAAGTGTGGSAAGDVLSNFEAVTGSAFNDTLTGSANADSLAGGAGDDVLTGNAGNDTLLGDAGNDTIQGGAGADALNGGAGIDTVSYSGSAAGVSVNLATSVVTGGDAAGDSISGFENITGSAFNDALVGDTNANVIASGDGNDTVEGGAGADSLSGGAGTDTVTYAGSSAAVNVNLTTGTGVGGDAQGDVLSGFETVIGSAFNDTLTGSANADSLVGGDGSDSLVGNAGNDTLTGGSGSDTLAGGAGADALFGGSGTDILDYSASGAAVQVILNANSVSGGDATGDTISGADGAIGSEFNDVLSGFDATGGPGDPFTNVFFGGGGDDVISGFGGGDSLYGGTGNDTIFGDRAGNSFTGADADLIAGGDGNDVIDGGADSDTILGDAGADSLIGAAGNDSISGGTGNDTVRGGTGADTLDGGEDIDTLDYSDSAAGVSVNLATGATAGGDAEGDVISRFENLTGSTSNDTLTGNDGANLIAGGAGNDTIRGGAGADTLDGGADIDTLDYSDSTAGVSVNLATGATAGGDAAGDVISGFENLIGSASNDTLTGNGGANTIAGGAGNDVINGGAGDDSLAGGEGSDTLTGGAGADTLAGGLGADTLIFGRGDLANGGDGSDVFTLDDLIDNDSTAPGTPDAPILINGGGQDTLPGSGDILDLSANTGWRNTPGDVEGSGTITLSDGTIINYTGIEQIICFTPGTMIRTLGGSRAIETLKPGDMVVTRDSGLQPIRWIGTSTVAGTGTFAPIRLRKGAVPDLTADLLVSPQHRMLIEGYRAELLFGEREVLASATHLVDGKYATVEDTAAVTYIHMLFDRHEVVFANGAATESYHPASYGLGGICEAAREELFAIFPELRSMPESYGQTARRVLKGYEAKALAW